MKKKIANMGFILLISCLILFSTTTLFAIGNKTDQLFDVKDSINFSDKTITDSSQNMKFSYPAWPMFGYNQYNTGLSPYSTEDVTGIERWRYDLEDWVLHSSPAIDSNNNIYIGTGDIFAIYPDGTLKWRFGPIYSIYSTPAIDENLGVIYFGTGLAPLLYSLYLNNGTLRWVIENLSGGSHSSPLIGPDGIIYVSGNNDMHAFYPNSTEKWEFSTGDVITSCPALSDDGILYFGSHDHKVYALWAENGTLIWTFDTGNWVHGAPAIGSDGTIYIGSDSGYLYALYPNNGTLKWQEWYGGMWAAPAIDDNGNLYFGVHQGFFYCLFPDGTEKWSFPLGDDDSVWGSTAAISDDGTIYFGNCIKFSTCQGGEIIALDLDGNLKWRKQISKRYVDSSPAISSDGAIYIGSSGSYGNYGFLHAFAPIESNDPPNKPIIDGPTEGKAGINQRYYFSSNDPDNNPIGFFIDWGDGETEWTIDFEPGEKIPVEHKWEEQGDYTIAVKARDSVGAESDWAYLEVTMPLNQQSHSYPLLDLFRDRFPILYKLMLGLLGRFS